MALPAVPVSAHEFKVSEASMFTSGTFGVPGSHVLRVADQHGITVTPAPGEVRTLQTFTLEFPEGQTVERGDVTYDNAPYVLSETSEQFWCFDMSFEANVMTLGVSSEITTSGSYTLYVPAGFYTVNGEAATEAYEFDYLVSASDSGIITEAPAGSRTEAQIWFLSWFVTGGALGGTELAGKPSHYILGDDDCLYLYNPIILDPFGPDQMDSYIKGEKNGDRYVFKFPQPVCETNVDGEMVTLYINRSVLTEDGTYSAVSGEDNKAEFMIDDNGLCQLVEPLNTLDEEGNMGFSNCIALFDAEGIWQGFGNLRSMQYYPFTYVAPGEPGSDVVIDVWEIRYWDSEGKNPTTAQLNIGIKDNDIWIQGLADKYLPGSWIHGVIDGDKITLDRYIGYAAPVGQYAFVLNTDGVTVMSATLTYDAENCVISDECDLVINPNEWFSYNLQYYYQPVISKTSTQLTTRVPKAPERIENFHVLNAETGYATFTAFLSTENIDGQPFNLSNLFYEVMLPSGEGYVFTPECYPVLEEPMSYVPYNREIIDGLVTGFRNQRNITVYHEDLTDIGCRMVYRDETGTYSSDITWSSGSMVDELSAEVPVVTRWFDFTGREITRPDEGMAIRCDVYPSGRIQTRKVVVR